MCGVVVVVFFGGVGGLGVGRWGGGGGARLIDLHCELLKA